MKVILIDETSMLNERNMRDIDMISKQIKENELYFGGMSIITIGDFLQLSPVIPPAILELPKGATSESHDMSRAINNNHISLFLLALLGPNLVES